jgi:predicted dehydrogenase
MHTRPIRVAVIGAGSFGRNHLRIYSELARSGAVHLAAIVDSSPNRAAALAAEFAPPSATPPVPFESVHALIAALRSNSLALDAASVCVPTIQHFAVADALLAAGIDVLVEKPFTATLAEADSLLARAAESKRILQVGHLERFNPAVIAALAIVNTPMFFESHRLSIFTPRSLDVDVVLDLMVHDLDIVLAMAASPVTEVRAVGLPILSPKTDIANVRVEFASGCVANFTASRVSTERVRKLRFFQPHQYISIDYARQDVLLIDVQPGPAPLESQSPMPQLGIHKLPVTQAEPLRLELEAFLESVRTRKPSAVPPQQSRDALALAFKISDEIAAHTRRAGLS